MGVYSDIFAESFPVELVEAWWRTKLVGEKDGGGGCWRKSWRGDSERMNELEWWRPELEGGMLADFGRNYGIECLKPSNPCRRMTVGRQDRPHYLPHRPIDNWGIYVLFVSLLYVCSLIWIIDLVYQDRVLFLTWKNERSQLNQDRIVTSDALFINSLGVQFCRENNIIDS